MHDRVGDSDAGIRRTGSVGPSRQDNHAGSSHENDHRRACAPRLRKHPRSLRRDAVGRIGSCAAASRPAAKGKHRSGEV